MRRDGDSLDTVSFAQADKLDQATRDDIQNLRRNAINWETVKFSETPDGQRDPGLTANYPNPLLRDNNDAMTVFHGEVWRAFRAQEQTPEALQVRAEVESGAVLYRLTTVGADGSLSQFMAPEDPRTTPDFAQRYGIPPGGNYQVDEFQLKPGAAFTTGQAWSSLSDSRPRDGVEIVVEMGSLERVGGPSFYGGSPGPGPGPSGDGGGTGYQQHFVTADQAEQRLNELKSGGSSGE